MGTSRQLQRNFLKQLYKLFVKNWRRSVVKDETGGYSKDNKPVTCPTFKQWVDLNKAHAAELKSKQLEEQSKKDEEFNKDGALEW